MEAATAQGRLAGGPARGGSRALLKLAPDELLVSRSRAGSEAAFALLYERHHRGVLAFCRHMLGSVEEAEDAVQQSFANAYRDMLRGEKEINFRPWLFRIARNQCISMLRARRPEITLDDNEPALAGLPDEVAWRAELRDLLRDLHELPFDQRAALVLSELEDNSHADVAEILGCDREKVKSLVFQARASLLKSREARNVSCDEIRRQLSVLRGGSRRRGLIRRHLQSCAGCREFDSEVAHQRQALAVVLAVVPSAGLKLGVAEAIAAAGMNGASGAGAAIGSTASLTAGASGGVGVATASGPLTALAAKLGVSTLAVKATVAVTAATVVVAGGGTGLDLARDVVGSTPPAPKSDVPAADRAASKGLPGIERAIERSRAERGLPGAAIRHRRGEVARGRARRHGDRSRAGQSHPGVAPAPTRGKHGGRVPPAARGRANPPAEKPLHPARRSEPAARGTDPVAGEQRATPLRRPIADPTLAEEDAPPLDLYAP
jgi:RNA polymerase sigma factor (sigma-70 family)